MLFTYWNSPLFLSRIRTFCRGTFISRGGQFSRGTVSLQNYIVENVEYPVEAIEKEEQGRVVVNFVVEPDGSLSNIKIEKSVSPSIDREALRLVRKMPNWEPAIVDGKFVRTKCRLPINFDLN